VSDHDERDDYDDEPRGRPLAPEYAVLWPARLMWLCGHIQLVFVQIVAFLYIAIAIALLAMDGDKEDLDGLWDAVQEPEFWLMIGGWVAATIWTAAIVRAANDLRRFRRYQFVVTATVLVLIPIPFLLIGGVQIPSAVWTLLTLARRDVRARFEAVARGTIPSAPPEAPDARADRPA
jgi:hypothetical protein